MFLLSLYSENRQINRSFSLKEHYNRPMYIVRNYTDELIRGLTTQNAQKVDMLFTPTVGLRFYVINKCTPKRSFWNSVVVHAVCFKKVLHQCTLFSHRPKSRCSRCKCRSLSFFISRQKSVIKIEKKLLVEIYTKNVCFEHRYLITPLTLYPDTTLIHYLHY